MMSLHNIDIAQSNNTDATTKMNVTVALYGDFTTYPSEPNDDEEVIVHSDALYGEHLAIPISAMIICSFGIPANLLTMIVLASATKLRQKPINIFLIHQCAADGIVCVLALIEEIIGQLSMENMVKPFVCHLILTKMASAMILYVSTYNIVFLTIERFSAIVNPLNYDPEKVRSRLPLLFIFIWLISICFMLFVPIATVIGDGQCQVGVKMFDTFLWDFYSPYDLTISIGIPLVIMIYCYTRMWFALKKSSDMITSMSTTKQEKGKQSSVHNLRVAQTSIFHTCLILVFIFITCWGTMESGLLLYLIGVYDNLGLHYNIGRVLTIFNSCINPFVLVIRYDDFKSQLNVLMKHETRSENSMTSRTQTEMTAA